MTRRVMVTSCLPQIVEGRRAEGKGGQGAQQRARECSGLRGRKSSPQTSGKEEFLTDRLVRRADSAPLYPSPPCGMAAAGSVGLEAAACERMCRTQMCPMTSTAHRRPVCCECQARFRGRLPVPRAEATLPYWVPLSLRPRRQVQKTVRCHVSKTTKGCRCPCHRFGGRLPMPRGQAAMPYWVPPVLRSPRKAVKRQQSFKDIQDRLDQRSRYNRWRVCAAGLRLSKWRQLQALHQQEPPAPGWGASPRPAAPPRPQPPELRPGHPEGHRPSGDATGAPQTSRMDSGGRGGSWPVPKPHIALPPSESRSRVHTLARVRAERWALSPRRASAPQGTGPEKPLQGSVQFSSHSGREAARPSSRALPCIVRLFSPPWAAPPGIRPRDQMLTVPITVWLAARRKLSPGGAREGPACARERGRGRGLCTLKNGRGGRRYVCAPCSKEQERKQQVRCLCRGLDCPHVRSAERGARVPGSLGYGGLWDLRQTPWRVS
ncbi:uncharacterized protein C16orf95 homolog [Talpa occidentalis]|uniref:uncharacterized protein C16orf95 homolog n=1 Tax=Talpa occidentalis TaxID=50954 RepID=UPI0023FA2C0A|nr:uncharacterized protein C16orf95 homolog [Talpa occidentalis]